MIGVKKDQNKPRISLLPKGTLKAVIRVLEFGATKYAENNWRHVPEAKTRYYDAMHRHVEAWCMSGSWWTATEAWQRACDYSNQSEIEFAQGKLKITTLTKKAWDSVYWLVEQGSMKEAFKQFKSIYETYLAKAQMQGRQQEWYVPPVMIATSKAAPKPKSMLPEQSPEEKAWLEGKIKELQSSGMTFPMAMFSAMKELQGLGGGV